MKTSFGFEGVNHTEEVVTFVINQKGQVGVVNVARKDTNLGVRSIPGGFVNKGETWGEGQTATREAGEETGQEIKASKLQSLGNWKCNDPRNSEGRWIETQAFLAVVFSDETELKAGDDAGAVNLVPLDSNYLGGDFYADHKKTILEAIKKLEERTGMKVDEGGFLKAEFPVGATFESIVDNFASKWENVGPKTLQRIWEKSEGDTRLVSFEIAKREFLADELLRADNSLEEFLEDFGKYAPLLECLIDGTQSPFGRFIRNKMPLLGLYTRSTPNSLVTQDYDSLFDKAVIRMSEHLSELEFESKETKRNFITSALLLDIAKAGNEEDRKSWKSINPYVHNVASAELVRRQGALPEVFIKLIEYHGYLGQVSRGEVTEHVLTGFTDWFKENPIENVSEMYYLLNVLDTKSVRDGLFTEKLDREFKKIRDKMEKVLKGEAEWGDEKIEDVNKKRESLADRLSRLRGGKDSEEALGTLLELPDDKVNYIYDLLSHAQLWYVENATAGLSVNNQLKLLVLAARISREKGADKYDNFDVNFVELMNLLKPGKIEDKGLIKVLDTALYNLDWEDAFSKSPNNELSIISVFGFDIKLTSNGGISGIKCELKPEFKEAVDLINTYYLGDRVKTEEERKKYKEALKILEEAVGMKLDEWDRGIVDQRSYEEAMNLTMNRKTAPLMPEIERLIKEKDSVTLVGVASGTGMAEWFLAHKMRKGDKVIATDISRVMCEGMRRLSRINKAQRYLDPEAQIAEFLVANSGATTLSLENLRIKSVDLITASSVDHEIDSYVDKTPGHGEALRNIYKSALSLLKESGQVFCDRDFIQDDNPSEIIPFRIGTAKRESISPLQFFRDFTRKFKLFTKSELKEIGNLPENLKSGDIIQISRAFGSEVGSHYSWMKDGGSDKEMEERHTRDDRNGKREFVMKIAEEMGIEIEVTFDMEDPEYAKHNTGEFDFLDKEGNPTRYPFWMGTMKIKKRIS